MTTPIKSAHALLLNRLTEMQRAPYYATARDELALAERTIVQLEAEIEANAKLIAATPEMLEALRRVDDYFTQPGEDDWVRFHRECLVPVRHAIKLATAEGRIKT